MAVICGTVCSTAHYIKSLVHFQNKTILIIYSPHVIQDVHICLSFVEKIEGF